MRILGWEITLTVRPYERYEVWHMRGHVVLWYSPIYTTRRGALRAARNLSSVLRPGESLELVDLDSGRHESVA